MGKKRREREAAELIDRLVAMKADRSRTTTSQIDGIDHPYTVSERARQDFRPAVMPLSVAIRCDIGSKALGLTAGRKEREDDIDL